MTKKLWDAMPLKERVLESALISSADAAEVLGVSVPHARKLIQDVRASDGEQPAVVGRTGVPYQALIDALYARRSKDGLAQAQKLESALGLRRKPRTLRIVPDTSEPLAEPQLELEFAQDDEGTIG